jgi:ATP-binding cassette subfamily B protein/subfamily B ATP-binding cassette protein MsbA
VIWTALKPHLHGQRRLLALAAAAMLGEVVTGLLTPWPLKYAFDEVLFDRSGGHTHVRSSLSSHELVILVAICAVALAVAIADAGLTYVDDRITTVVAQRAVNDLRRAVFAHLQRLSMSFHAGVETQLGDLLSRLNGDIQALQDLAASGLSNLVVNGLGILTAVLVMLVLDWRLALLALVFTIPMYVVGQRTMVKMRVATRTARRQEGRVGATLQEALGAVKLVQAFSREPYEEQRLKEESARSLEASLDAAKLQSRLTPVLALFSAAAQVVVLLAGVALVIRRSITPGDLLIFLAYLRSMQSPVRQLSKLSFAFGKATAGAERVQELFARQPDVTERAGALRMGRARGHVQFERVVFGYGPEREVLRGLSLEAKPGQTIAVVGASGAGKSTLLSLLPRFYDPWSGRILLDGHDVRDLTLPSLRANVALVLQETMIIRATLSDNIAYGLPGASPDAVRAAAQAAGAHRLADRLPEGYETVLSERGSSLSGGERQCIGIARAMLKDAPVVILDEPTSSMDSLTEREVMAGIERLLEGRTAFIIAHRLATVWHADVVAVIDRGRLVELGPPRTLLAGGGRFADLAAAQGLQAHGLASLR